MLRAAPQLGSIESKANIFCLKNEGVVLLHKHSPNNGSYSHGYNAPFAFFIASNLGISINVLAQV